MPTALVTGAGIRVGRAIAGELASRGYDLALHAHRSGQGAEQIADSIRDGGRVASVHLADFSKPSGPERLAREVIERFEKVDLVVHNAAIFEKAPFEDLSRERFDRTFAINVDAPFFLTQKLLPALHRAKSPAVIFISDIVAARTFPGYAHYAASKAALDSLTRSLAVELAPRVRVNAVSPGAVAFPPDFDEGMKARMVARVPLEREGSPQDVARTVAFLANDAPYITGETIRVDGGRSSAP
jgi:pteridine reductase